MIYLTNRDFNPQDSGFLLFRAVLFSGYTRKKKSSSKDSSIINRCILQSTLIKIFYYYLNKINSNAVGTDSWVETAGKSNFLEILFLDQMYNLTLLSLNSFLYSFSNPNSDTLDFKDFTFGIFKSRSYSPSFGIFGIFRSGRNLENLILNPRDRDSGSRKHPIS